MSNSSIYLLVAGQKVNGSFQRDDVIQAVPLIWETLFGTGAVISENDKVVTFVNSVTGGTATNKTLSTGKWYWEMELISLQGCAIGLGPSTGWSEIYGLKCDVSGTLFMHYPGTDIPVQSVVAGDIFGFAVDMDVGSMDLFRNGTVLGTLGTTLPASSPIAAFTTYDNNINPSSVRLYDGSIGYGLNYSPPTGYQPVGLYI